MDKVKSEDLEKLKLGHDFFDRIMRQVRAMKGMHPPKYSAPKKLLVGIDLDRVYEEGEKYVLYVVESVALDILDFKGEANLDYVNLETEINVLELGISLT